MAAIPVKGGGRPGATEYLFEITGGALCLDLANTVDNRPTVRRELLGRYADLLAWARQSGALTRRQADVLSGVAEASPGRARAALARARAVREALFDLFSAAAGGQALPRQSVTALNDAARVASARRHLAPAGDGLSWTWREEAESSLDLPAWKAALSAVELVTSPRLGRVRCCEADDCAWLFLDGSRNGSRRWCDMTVCGNRAKVRRFRRKSKGGSWA